MKTLRCRKAGRFLSTVSSLLLFLLIATASRAADVRHLWQSRDQFVALESTDAGPGLNAVPNNHPCDIAQDRLTALLASLDVRTSDSSGFEPVFTTASLEVLVPQLQSALRQATPAEDVTFAVIGLHKTMIGFVKIPKVTTGRVFYKDGRLNIIFGLVQRDINDREDRRLAPFTPGRRSSAASGDWRLLPQEGRDMVLLRKDWVAFGSSWKAPVVQPAAPATQPAPAVQPASAQGAPDRPARRIEDTRTPAERLTTLKELKDKGLISDEEYGGKRQEILNGL